MDYNKLSKNQRKQSRYVFDFISETFNLYVMYRIILFKLQQIAAKKIYFTSLISKHDSANEKNKYNCLTGEDIKQKRVLKVIKKNR